MTWLVLAVVAQVLTSEPIAADSGNRRRALLSDALIAALQNAQPGSELSRLWDGFQASLQPHDGRSIWSPKGDVDLLSTALAGTVTQRESLISNAKYLLSLACGQKQWCQPGNEWRAICLRTAETAAAVSLAYNWLYDDLSPAERQRVGEALGRLAFEPFSKAVEEGSHPIGAYTDNWCAVVNSGIGTAAAIMAPESELAAKLLPITTRQVVGVLDEMGVDGGWAEGPGYWSYALESILKYAQVLEDLGIGVEAIATHEALARTSRFALQLALPGGTVASLGDTSPAGMRAAPIYRLAGLLKDPRLQWLAEQTRQTPRWIDVVWGDSGVAPAPPTPSACAEVFGHIGWASMRSGWDDDARVLATSSGQRTAHSHLDANHFVLHAFGETLMVDWGRRPYPSDYFTEGGKARYWWSDTRGHNAVLMDGQGQLCDAGQSSHITHFVSGPHCDYVRSDATAAYPQKAKAVVRDMIFVRPDYFIVLDELSAKWETKWEWLAQFTGEMSLDGEGATLLGARAALRIEALWSRSWNGEEREHPRGDRYVSLSPLVAVPEALLVTVLYPWPRVGNPSEAHTCPARFQKTDGGAQVTRPSGQVDEVGWRAKAGGEGPPAVAIVTHSAKGQLEGFSGFGVSKVSTEGRLLLGSDEPLWASVRVGEGELRLSALVTAPGQAVSIYCPRPPTEVTSAGVPPQWSHDPATGLLQVSLPTGNCEVVVALGGRG